jgi:hypothetical protein
VTRTIALPRCMTELPQAVLVMVRPIGGLPRGIDWHGMPTTGLLVMSRVAVDG